MGKRQEARRKLDYAVVERSFPDPAVIVSRWTAFGSNSEAELRRPSVRPEQACVYDFELNVRSSVRGGGYHAAWTLRIDAAASDYPDNPPRLVVVSSPKPWVPHVHSSGAVCLDSTYRPIPLVARFVLSFIRILNWDSGHAPDYLREHLNPDATDWWLRTHAGAPLAELDYPAIHDQSVEPLTPLFGEPLVAEEGPGAGG